MCWFLSVSIQYNKSIQIILCPPRSTRSNYSLSESSEASKTCLEIESFSSYMPTYHLVIIWLHKFMITSSGWCPCWVCVGGGGRIFPLLPLMGIQPEYSATHWFNMSKAAAIRGEMCQDGHRRDKVEGPAWLLASVFQLVLQV